MRIQHNIMAMSAYRNYNTNTSALSKNLEKLSSGYKINRAGDDAAGLAISEKMRAQITGLNAAQKNVKDGISLVKTAEGAMQEIQDMLNRMDYLATQSANGTYQDEVDRENLNKEMTALKEEINRIADSANFNGIKLLDGTLDLKNTTGRTTETAAAALKQLTIPDDGTGKPNADMDAGKTVLKKGGNEATATKFNVDLRTLGVNGADGDTMEISIGDATITIDFSDTATLEAKDVADTSYTLDANDASKTSLTLKAGEYSTEDLATALSKAFGENGVKIGGEAFDVTPPDGTVLKFTEKGTGSGVSGALTVQVTYTASGGDTVPFANDDAPTYEISGEGKTVSINDAAWDGTKNTISLGTSGSGTTIADGNAAGTASTGLDQSAILDALNATDASLSGAVTIELAKDENGDAIVDADGNYTLGLFADGVMIGSATLAGNDLTTTATDIEFEDAEGNSLGKVNIKATGADVDVETAFGTAIATGLEVDAAAPGVSATIAGTEALANALADGGATATDAVTIKRNATDDGWEIEAGAAKIAVADGDVTDDGGVLTLKDGTTGETLMTITSSDNTSAAADFQGAAAFATAFDTGLKIAEKQADPNPPADDAVTGPKGQYESKTIVIESGLEEKAQQLASTELTLSTDFIKDGGELKIGETSIKFVAGDETKLDGTTITFDKSLTGDDLFNAVGEALSRIEDVDGAFDLGYVKDSGLLGVFEQNGQTKYGIDVLGNKDEFEKLFSAGTAAVTTTGKVGAALNLQIGDSSDDFNQMKVSIGDMHTDAMVTKNEDGTTSSIASINILTSDNAQAAVDVIKNAINYVSSVRGDLGAYQNRLEHTANNLSVMAENIQDAESTIRDTDIAEEMMSYTKNNILVQSAQAMLAQANAVPQGVLQLLG